MFKKVIFYGKNVRKEISDKEKCKCMAQVYEDMRQGVDGHVGMSGYEVSQDATNERFANRRRVGQDLMKMDTYCEVINVSCA